MSDLTFTLLPFDQLAGWDSDDHLEALTVFFETNAQIAHVGWEDLATTPRHSDGAKAFFEQHFRPVLIEDGEPMLFTGYFEPEVIASRYQSERFRHAIYRLPPDLQPDQPYLSRQEIDEYGALAHKGLEIAWLADPIDHYFLQVQGSGRLILDDGSRMRVGFAGKNGRPYSSLGASLIDHGKLTASEMSADAIREWADRNPEEARATMSSNESYVFFRGVVDVPEDRGPLGAMNRSVTPMRSIAVDPAITPLGAPVWIEVEAPLDLRRLMVAQDTGAAIKGAQRADIYFGTGAESGSSAGRVRYGGRMIVLMPHRIACTLTGQAPS